VSAQQRVVEKFFGASIAPFELKIVPTHAAMQEIAAARWKVPELPCWAVAMGTGSTLLLLEPAAWKTEACDHATDTEADIDRVIAHELAHVFQGQQRPADRELANADDVGWFVEGLATYASGQLTPDRIQQVRELVAAGKAPTKLADAWTGKTRYGVSGSLVKLVDERFGRAKLLAALTASTQSELLAALGTTEDQLLAQWRAAFTSK
jgi:hypothetical protein